MMGVAGGCQVKEMEVGVRNVNWMLVGAWTTGSAITKKNVHDRHKIHVLQPQKKKIGIYRPGHFSLNLYYTRDAMRRF